MSLRSGARFKCFIQNLDTGEVMYFQLNPPSLSTSRGSSFSEIASAGMPIPKVQFSKGENRNIADIPMYLFDNPYTGLINEKLTFLRSLLPPETDVAYSRPPAFIFCFGEFVRKCVLKNLSEEITRFDGDGRYTEAVVTLSLIQVGI